LAHGIATVALAIILFDGGLRTPFSSFKRVWKPALALATVGVVVTAAITGLAAAWLLKLPLLEGLLLGSIISSTDAAVVFAVLRGRGLRLREHVSATLEVESGSNDPMAVLLTVVLIEIILKKFESPWSVASFFILQLGVGAAAGYAVGRAGAAVVNRVNLDAAGLYPILVGAFGFLSFGIAAAAGGSGFLAVYVAGIVLGNRRIVFERGVFLFHDGAAWLSQITLFIMLGLLSFPSRLLAAAPSGFLVAAVLTLFARPAAVALLLWPFRFSLREIGLISWVGLKGAVPIVLAIYPLIFGVPDSLVLFDIVFFVVVISALAQGWTLPWFARKLKLDLPQEDTPAVTLEITSLRHLNGDIVEYAVTQGSRAANRLVRELSLPEDTVVAMIARAENVIPPRGSTRIQPGDHVFVVLRSDLRAFVDRAFSITGEAHEPVSTEVEFPLLGTTQVQKLLEFYDIAIDAPPETTLDGLLRSRISPMKLAPGCSIQFGGVTLTVRRLNPAGKIEQVGLTIA
jgi:cell volume regulation protein A